MHLRHCYGISHAWRLCPAEAPQAGCNDVAIAHQETVITPIVRHPGIVKRCPEPVAFAFGALRESHGVPAFAGMTTKSERP